MFCVWPCQSVNQFVGAFFFHFHQTVAKHALSAVAHSAQMSGKSGTAGGVARVLPADSAEDKTFYVERVPVESVRIVEEKNKKQKNKL